MSMLMNIIKVCLQTVWNAYIYIILLCIKNTLAHGEAYSVKKGM